MIRVFSFCSAAVRNAYSDTAFDYNRTTAADTAAGCSPFGYLDTAAVEYSRWIDLAERGYWRPPSRRWQSVQ